MAGRDVIKGSKINPLPGSPPATRMIADAVEAISKHQILYVDSAQTGIFPATELGVPLRQKVGVATNATKAKADGELYVALMSAPSGGQLLIAPLGMLKNLDTSGAAKGDPVYLGTAGAPTLTPAGFRRVIGRVLIVGASGTGVVSFQPNGQANPAGAKRPILGTVSAATGAASVTVAAAALGGSFGGAEAFAQMMTAEATASISSVTWSTNDLVITFTPTVSGTRTVAYQVWV